jgi:hypothetical protein
MEPVESRLRINEEVGRPDPQDGPAEVLKDDLPDPTAVARGRHRVIGGPVAFDAREIAPRGVGVDEVLRSRTASLAVRVRSIIAASKLAKTTTSVVARVIATLRRRSPPFLLSGPKLIDMVRVPGSVGP